MTSGTVALREEAPWLAPSKLSRLSLEQAAALASDVLDEALARLRAPDARQEIDTLHDTVRQSVDAAGTVKALTRLVRSGRQLVSSEAGPAKATEFFSRVEELFQEG